MFTTLTTEAHWSLGFLIGTPIAALVILALIASGWLGVRYRRNASDWDRGPALAWIIGSWVTAALFLIAVLSPLGLYPYKAEYHQWQPHSGTVASVDKRLMGGSDSLEEKFVVRFVGSSQQYGCSDTRCASVRDGDRLELTCIRSWEWAATDGYDCRFVSTEVSR